ncbi:unnamed protein product [Angiostrongylus costaricensis]|uniref:MFS domain-containing protein n=1 Tax=Angiostrongylus costaricensis TaxID=334426 RepID=A0A0R3P9R3_ANGCS|nr:unnamed protein product [Angiostrongylus costaricensis]
MVVGAILSIGRLLIGIQAGASLCLLPLYIIEISPLEHRPFLSTFQQVSQALGTLLGLLIGSEEILHLGSSRPLRKSLKGFLVGVAASASYAFTADDLIDTFSAKMLTVHYDLWQVDRFGRRHLLLFGLFGSSAAMCLPAFFPEQKLLVSLGFTLTKAFIGLGAGAPPWFLTSELVGKKYD